MNEWHFITCEYPPMIGGVADHTFQMANGLAAAGDAVHVWTPSAGTAKTPHVNVHPEMGFFTPSDLRRAGRMLDRFPSPRRLFVQWVPHGYGCRSLNVYFCDWLRRRVIISGDHIELMIHEPYLPFNLSSWRQSAAAVVHRLMLSTLLAAAKRVWLPTPSWKEALHSWMPRRNRPQIGWLPVPSNVAVERDCAALRCREQRNERLTIGHFGTYRPDVINRLARIVPELLRSSPHWNLLFIGAGSAEFRSAFPNCFEGRIAATGVLAPAAISRCLQMCDVMIQPYPDGVSTRRTSVMAGLIHGLPIVTNSGSATEALWGNSGAVRLTPTSAAPDFVAAVTALADDPRQRVELGAAGRRCYQQHFEIGHTIRRLRDAAQGDIIHAHRHHYQNAA